MINVTGFRVWGLGFKVLGFLVHLGRRGNPQASGQLAVELRKHLSGGTVVA